MSIYGEKIVHCDTLRDIDTIPDKNMVNVVNLCVKKQQLIMYHYFLGGEAFGYVKLNDDTIVIIRKGDIMAGGIEIEIANAFIKWYNIITECGQYYETFFWDMQ